MLGTFAALALGIATMFVRTLTAKLQRVGEVLVFFFASRMSAAKRDHLKRKSSSKQHFFPMDISSLSGKYPFLVCFLEYN